MFRLSVAQSPGEFAGPAERLSWLREILPAIRESGADLLLLPELFACGYNIADALETHAEPVSGPTVAAIADLARAFGLAIHFGFAERGDDGLYNAAACIGPDGALLCHQRKLAIPPGFERDHFLPGRGCQLFEFCGFKIATLICYDAEFAETVRHVAAQGAQLVLVPTALSDNWAWVAETMIPTRAYENGVFLAYANSAGTENGVTYLGASCIAAPNGTELARAGTAPEFLFADLDIELVRAAQQRLPYLADRLSIQLATKIPHC